MGLTASSTRTVRLSDDDDDDDDDDEDKLEDKSEGPTSKRCALLVGISYNGAYNQWPALNGPHNDVDRFRQLLTGTYSSTSLRPLQQPTSSQTPMDIALKTSL
jgi:hypothetical protein